MTTGRKILIVEPDPAAAFPLGAALRRNGWLIVQARDASAAMTIARQQKPDAVLLSSRAGVEGVATLRLLRSSISTARIPVIGIVAPDDPERVALHAGAAELIPPPGDPDTIDSALRRQLGRSGKVLLVPQSVLAEPERLMALERSGLVDTPPEEPLDRIARLTARLLGVPIARLTLVDAKRQFFKSQVDVSASPSMIRETPLENSACQWVVGGREDLIVNDMREDAVLKVSPVVADGVMAYAGVPFSLDEREVLGSFCVIDLRPRTWSEMDVLTLRDLGLVMRAYADGQADPAVRLHNAGRGVIGATSVLLRHVDAPEGERKELGSIVEELAGRVAKQTWCSAS